jgi:crossover junction endodeoxyribonuclease RusA
LAVSVLPLPQYCHSLRAREQYRAGGRTVSADWKCFDFWVPGKAAPQGSKRHVGRGILVESSRELGPWRERVALQASADMRSLGFDPVAPHVPVGVRAEFVLPRLASAPKSRPHPPAVTRPDLDKLLRAVLDAITGPVIHDDAQVVRFLEPTGKRRANLGEEPGCWIQVERLS